MEKEEMKLPAHFVAIPCRGKIPEVKWSDYQTRYPTPEEKSSWNLLYPNSGIGIVTGKLSKVLVLDDDGGLAVTAHRIPPTWTQKTPRGGKHYFFKWIPELDDKITTNVGILPKVDTRGEGGFVAFYGWEKSYYATPMMPPPQWLIDLLPDRSSSITDTPKKLDYTETLQNIKEGNRNDTFAKLAGGLRARGLDFEAIYEFLLPKAKEVGFSERELQKVCKSICRYPMGSGESGVPDSLEAFLQDTEAVEWIVPQLVAKKSLTFIAGIPKCLKSWIVVDLAVELARENGLWLGKYPTKKCNVLYLDQERSSTECRRRFKGIIQGKNLEVKELSLTVRPQSKVKIDLEQSFNAFKQTLERLKPDVVLIDSFVKFHTKDVKDQTSIQPVLDRIQELQHQFNCSFIFIYHDRKSVQNPQVTKDPSFEDMVGSIFIPAAADHCFSVRKQDKDSSMLYHTANNYGDTLAPILVKVEDLNLERTKFRVVAY